MSNIYHSEIKGMSLQLVVANLEHSIEFYTRQLGFEVDFRYEDFYVGIIKDGFSIHLKSGQPLTEIRKARRTNEDLDIIFSVLNIEGLYKDLREKNIEIIQPLRVMPYGKEFYITDPDGYILSYLGTE